MGGVQATAGVHEGSTDGLKQQQCDLTGCYIDNWRRIIIVEQLGTKLSINCHNEKLEAEIDGNLLKVPTFYSNGTIDEKGHVIFNDGGHWTRCKALCKGKKCHDLSGTYIDNYKNKVVVVQRGHKIDVDYGGRKKVGFICGKSGCCSGIVYVASFESSGTIDEEGNVKFADGGLWQKQGANAFKDECGTPCAQEGGLNLKENGNTDTDPINSGADAKKDDLSVSMAAARFGGTALKASSVQKMPIQPSSIPTVTLKPTKDRGSGVQVITAVAEGRSTVAGKLKQNLNRTRSNSSVRSWYGRTAPISETGKADEGCEQQGTGDGVVEKVVTP